MVASEARAQRARHHQRRQAGQSLIEFALMVPIIIGLIVSMREVNMAINSAIVHQRYARGTMHFLFFNHRYYPERGLIERGNQQFMHRWWVGVGKEKVTDENSTPKAPTIRIGRTKAPQDEEAGAQLPSVTSRQNVRIRVTSFICLPPWGNSITQPFTEGGLSEDTFLPQLKYGYCRD